MLWQSRTNSESSSDLSDPTPKPEHQPDQVEDDAISISSDLFLALGSTTMAALSGMLGYVKRDKRLVGFVLGGLVVGYAGIVLLCRRGLLHKVKQSDTVDSSLPTKKDEGAAKPTEDVAVRKSGYTGYSNWMSDDPECPNSWPNPRILIREGPLHLLDFTYYVMSRMKKLGFRPGTLDDFAELLAEEDRLLQQERPDLPWTQEDDDLQCGRYHSDWRQGLDEKVVALWEGDKKSFPAHFAVLQAGKEVGFWYSSLYFALAIVLNTRVHEDPFENAQAKHFEEVFEAYDRYFDADREKTKEIRRLMETLR